MTDPYNEKHETLKKLKKTVEGGEALPCSRIDRANIVKMVIVPSVIVPRVQYYQNSNEILHRNGKGYPSFHLESQNLLQSLHSGTNASVGGIKVPGFKTRYRDRETNAA